MMEGTHITNDPSDPSNNVTLMLALYTKGIHDNHKNKQSLSDLPTLIMHNISGPKNEVKSLLKFWLDSHNEHPKKYL